MHLAQRTLRTAGVCGARFIVGPAGLLAIADVAINKRDSEY